jgi:hypothetical protein
MDCGRRAGLWTADKRTQDNRTEDALNEQLDYSLVVTKS